MQAFILDGADFSKYSVEGSEGNSLGKLSKINVFVGANNSGKSRFLRNLASVEDFRFVPTQSLEAMEEIRKTLVEGIQKVASQNRITDAGGFMSAAAALQPLTSVKEREQFAAPLSQLLGRIARQDTNGFSISMTGMAGADPSAILRELKKVAAPLLDRFESVTKELPEQFSFKRIYIPTLRGLRSMGSADVYETRTRKDYFASARDLQIFTGLTLYNDLQKLLLGTLEEREKAAAFQDFLSDSFFEGQPLALIPKHGGDVLDVKIGEEMQRPIFSLGDGIQSIIIMTFPLFENRDKPVLLFVEEPELYLHPGMQRLLLNALLQFPHAQSFLATHSNHLLDLTLDIEQVSVFTFRKKLEESEQREKDAHVTIENVSNEDDRSLQLLGSQNSSVFLSNCTIWVEGITDRRYVSHYLNLYQAHLRDDAKRSSSATPREYRQDLHYSFVEYAGANITHFSFLDNESDPIVVERLCAKLLLVTDKDDESKGGKGERHQALAEKLKERYVCLDSREVENLLTPNVISKIVKSYEGEDVTLNPFGQDDYKNLLLGEFIEGRVLTSTRKRTASYKTESGTVSDKVTFCQKALEHITRFEDLSPEAQKLTKKIYEFIETMNR